MMTLYSPLEALAYMVLALILVTPLAALLWALTGLLGVHEPLWLWWVLVYACLRYANERTMPYGP